MTWKPALAWTSRHPREGRRHFRLVLQGGRGSGRWVELVSVLTPEVRLRQSFQELQDRTQWQSGWQTIPPDEPENA
ncbi:MAG: TIGR02450 family Trp-rich protein [Planctomycetaceae bacterium TMED241]|nr:TIGR02450 family Trp-rich protein [Synechococcus sp. KORDI-49]MBL6738834.1 TIGR02450 family Trp-rich protein [Synechococcus sp. BS301-5m-G54]MBL6795571.1 TIGR02450 family Trp-rich protein [Synechococcus sp. BS307-5m-G34]RCL54217.1 MAG: TIGR02450 family Trp-rich protein [Synechococcus sp. MED-G70]RPG12002.1 MAG: TIGR02450 family Trp-rich protein [Planctomycetaceae bacterium TMED241]